MLYKETLDDRVLIKDSRNFHGAVMYNINLAICEDPKGRLRLFSLILVSFIVPVLTLSTILKKKRKE